MTQTRSRPSSAGIIIIIIIIIVILIVIIIIVIIKIIHIKSQHTTMIYAKIPMLGHYTTRDYTIWIIILPY